MLLAYYVFLTGLTFIAMERIRWGFRDLVFSEGSFSGKFDKLDGDQLSFERVDLVESDVQELKSRSNSRGIWQVQTILGLFESDV